MDERTLGLVSAELSMFMRWVEDHRGRMLKPDEAEKIAQGILAREGIQFGNEDLLNITTLAFAGDIAQVDELRKKTRFDDTIDGFCRSIGIPKP